ncbi:hypothetical protein IQ06DRAFT_52106 [Phaeosphaeriaceae sp. SRC1lsM3a]|nr:hypothetical protein IQ06DRAFT_52106 [Stagonospora sp. SRC1lsM3a]
MIKTTETTALASNKSTPTRRASWKAGADTNTRNNLHKHMYSASTPFLTEKNDHPLSLPPHYSSNSAQRSLADIEAQGAPYTFAPKRSRSRFTTIVLCTLLFVAICGLFTWALWDGTWVGSMRYKIGELKHEVGDMEGAVRGMKEVVKGLGRYLDDLRGAMLGGEGEINGTAMGMEMGMEMAGQNMGEQVTWEWQEM